MPRLEVTDGRLSGFGEASHSNDDERCKALAARLFAEHFSSFALSLDSLARKLAVILHRMWIDGSQFRWGPAPAQA